MARTDDHYPVPPLSGTSEETAARLKRLQSLHPKVIDLSLGRIKRLLTSLSNPERTLPPVIHVAGTNGKGSVTAFLRAILECARLRVHVYTSPHLIRFNERIRLAGQLIDDASLCQALEDCERANGDHPITFFEATTAAALLAFSRSPADIVILETGLGGRLDATNVIDKPVVTALTPIGLDHQQFLGNDLKAIAAEKAGILKPEIPAVIARQTADADAVIASRARQIGAPLVAEGDAWKAHQSDGRMVYEDNEGVINLPTPALSGPHQIQNAGVAISCARALTGIFVPETAFAQGTNSAHWPGRLQRLTDGPLVRLLPGEAELWLDGGHNQSAGEALSAALKMMVPDSPLVMIVGMLNTKDVCAFLQPFNTSIFHLYAVPVPNEPAGQAPDVLAAQAHNLGIPADPYQSVTEALRAIALLKAPQAPRIIICGSLYLAGRVLGDNCMENAVN